MPYRYVVKKVKDFFVYRVLHVDDTPHRIALGVAIGIFVTWTPTIGLQMILTVLLCWMLRANKVVGVPFVWISNPLTIVPIYYPNYLVGRWLLGGDYGDFDFHKAIAGKLGAGWLERVQGWAQATMQIFWPLWVGSLVVGLLLGALSYPLIYYAVVKYRALRQRRAERKARRKARRKERREARRLRRQAEAAAGAREPPAAAPDGEPPAPAPVEPPGEPPADPEPESVPAPEDPAPPPPGQAGRPDA